jgi:hypothetical protein
MAGASISVVYAPRSEEFRQRSQYVLFVEGATDASIDAFALKHLTQHLPITVTGLGGAQHLAATAAALAASHPNYFFLADRDDRNDSEVTKSWSTFTHSNTSNLLFWRKRELENYFLDSTWLSKSDHCKKSATALEDDIVNRAKRRLLVEVANYAVLQLRRDFSSLHITTFTDLSMFKSVKAARSAVVTKSGVKKYKSFVDKKLTAEGIEARFDAALKLFCNGDLSLSDKKGRWRDLMSGKEIFHEVADSNAFKATDITTKKPLAGANKRKAVVESLLSHDAIPSDFLELKNLLEKAISRRP